MPIVGYGGRTVNVLRLFTARSSDEFDIGIFNAGDYIARRAAQDHHRGDLEDPLSLGPASSTGASCGCCRSTSSSPAPCATSMRRYHETHDYFDELRRQGRDPDERHASGADGRRADAHVRRRTSTAVGAGVGDDVGDVSATRITRCCPRRWSNGRSSCWSACCRGTCRSSRRSIGALVRRGRAPLPGRRRPHGADVDHRATATTSTCGWRTSPMAGSHSVNGVAALHSELVKTNAAARTSPSSGRSASTTRRTA